MARALVKQALGHPVPKMSERTECSRLVLWVHQSILSAESFSEMWLRSGSGPGLGSGLIR